MERSGGSAQKLEKLGIFTLRDFLYHIPSRYEDYSIISPISALQPGEIVTIRGTVIDIKNLFTKRINIQKALVADENARIEVVWFNQPFLIRSIHKGSRIALSGTVDVFGGGRAMKSPEYEIISEAPDTQLIHTGRLVPIYPETARISSKWLRRQIHTILTKHANDFTEYLPEHILKNHQFLDLPQALWKIHFPHSLEEAQKAKNRLAFDELFLLNLAAHKRKEEWNAKKVGNRFFIAKFKKEISAFWNSLPFTLTNAQQRAVKEIFKDIASPKPMNRLLAGDVGSGKTVVGTIAMYLAFLNGFQSVLMAPTEILAQQHYKTISELLTTLGVSVHLITGSVKTKRGKQEKPDILVGTHALLARNDHFETVGLVIIDEQQRFGVEQRALIRQKGENPHFLTMTATPIPRTVALTLYGDLDLSFLDEMPKGRIRVKTWFVPEEKRKNAYAWIEKQIKTFQSQTFIICPFIDRSETMQSVKAATKEFEYLKKEMPHVRFALLHGRMSSKEKESVLEAFRKKDADILVSTPVVEVGIDIPNATIMVIEGAERFGLAQLHQMRGRVGRGTKESYCLLFTQSSSQITIQRLKAMEEIHVGARLAELDLKLRGPGDVFGVLQHGMPSLKIASFSDFGLIAKARNEAEELFPKLSSYPLLVEKLKEVTSEKVSAD